MLVLNRKKGERVLIGQDIYVTVLEVRGSRVRLGFDCPKEVTVHRQELSERIAQSSPLVACAGAP